MVRSGPPPARLSVLHGTMSQTKTPIPIASCASTDRIPETITVATWQLDHLRLCKECERARVAGKGEGGEPSPSQFLQGRCNGDCVSSFRALLHDPIRVEYTPGAHLDAGSGLGRTRAQRTPPEKRACPFRCRSGLLLKVMFANRQPPPCPL